MTPEQWRKVLEAASALTNGGHPTDPVFWEAVRGLVVPVDEAALDAQLSAKAAAAKQAEIASLEKRLAELKGR